MEASVYNTTQVAENTDLESQLSLSDSEPLVYWSHGLDERWVEILWVPHSTRVDPQRLQKAKGK